ncbi:MAG: hypothetical protein AAF989_16150 [Planctomycetota bacterium]
MQDSVTTGQPGRHDETSVDLRSSERGTVTAGCLLTMASGLLTCLMLFINGSLVMAILVAATRVGPAWLGNQSLIQFLLFSMPVALTVLQWMMVDYVRTRLFEKPR